MLHGLGLSSEVKSDEEVVANYTTIAGTGFLDIVKLLFTILCAFYLFSFGIVHVESNDPFDLFRDTIRLFISIMRLVSRMC